MKLRELAHARTGDKGNVLTISVIAYRPEDYPLIEKQVTAKLVSDLFSSLIVSPASRYELPKLSALNFVLQRMPQKSVTTSLSLDAHGKCLGYALLDVEIDTDDGSLA
jgi:hypothetical protein